MGVRGSFVAEGEDYSCVWCDPGGDADFGSFEYFGSDLFCYLFGRHVWMCFHVLSGQYVSFFC